MGVYQIYEAFNTWGFSLGLFVVFERYDLLDAIERISTKTNSYVTEIKWIGNWMPGISGYSSYTFC